MFYKLWDLRQSWGLWELHSPVQTGLVAVIKQFNHKSLYYFALNARKTQQNKSLICDETNFILSKTPSA